MIERIWNEYEEEWEEYEYDPNWKPTGKYIPIAQSEIDPDSPITESFMQHIRNDWEPQYPYYCFDGIITSEKQLSPSERRRLKALWEYKTANINHAEAQVLEREIDEENNNHYFYKE